MRKKVVILTFLMAAVAVLFPPWGIGGHSFETFSFLFSAPKSDSIFSYSIVWKTLGLEISGIFFIGVAAYFMAKD